MVPEILSQSIIELLTDTFDPAREGAAIEIGVGTDNFYCLKYSDAGLKCVAVDPVPYPPFLDLSRERKIDFEEACIYDQEGELTLFCNKHSDLSSINKDWWGVKSSYQKTVKAILLPTLLEKYGIDLITFLKIDTEGSELEIVKQIADLNISELPRIIEFEYGGGATKQSGEGAWSEKYASKVNDIIRTLQGLGYKQGLILDSSEAIPVFFDLETVKDPSDLFLPHYEYGNLLVFKNQIENTAKFENVILKAQAVQLQSDFRTLKAQNHELYLKTVKNHFVKNVVKRMIKVFKGK